MKIASKLTVLFASALLLPLIIFASFSLKAVHDTLQDHTLGEMSSRAQFVGSGLTKFIDGLRTRASDWSSDAEIRRTAEAIIVGGKGSLGPGLGVYLKNDKMPIEPAVAVTDVMDFDGRIVASSDASRLNRAALDAAGRRQLRFDELRTASPGTVLLVNTGAEASVDYPLRLVAPIISPTTGEAVGVLVLQATLESLQQAVPASLAAQFVAEEPRLRSFEVLVIDSAGRVLASSRATMTGPAPTVIKDSPAEQCFRSQQNYVGPFIGDDGVPVVGATYCVEGGLVSVISRLDQKEIDAEVYPEYTLLGATGLALLGLAAAAVFVFGHRLSHRVVAVESALQGLTSGDFDAHIKLAGHDEISAIGQKVNQLGAHLGRVISDLKSSEERFRRLFDTSPDCIKVLDPQGKLLMLSRGGLLEHGFQGFEETQGWDYLATVDEKQRAAVKDALMRSRGGETVYLDVQHGHEKTRGASNRDWCNMTFTALRDQAGEVSGTLVISRDISERKRAEQILNEEQQRYVDLVNNLTVGVFRATPAADGLPLEANPAAVALFEAGSRDELLRHRLGEVFKDEAEWRQIIETILKEGSVKSREVRLVTLKKGEFWGAITTVKKTGAKGEIYIDAIVEDITDRKEAELRAAELNALKNKFIQVVAHQLRTPLNAVRWSLEGILGKEAGRVPKAQEGLLRVAYKSNVEVLTRVSDMLMALDIENGSMKAEKSRVNLLDIVRPVEKQFKTQCQIKGIKCSFHYPKAVLEVNGDAAHLRASVEKLLDNALSYTHADGRVEVTVSRKDDKARVEVADTGIGVPEIDKARLFERFYRGANAAVVRPDASGLGLYIAKNLLAANGGTLDFISEEGNGSTFWFELPVIK